MSGHPLPPPTAESRLLPWLLDVLRPMSRTAVKQLLRDGRVVVNGTAVTRHDHPLTPADRVNIARDRPAAPSSPADGRGGPAVLFEDDALIVVDKPSGLLTVATDAEKTETAFARLAARLAARRAGRPYVVHRLDRDTSGLLLFARTEAARDRLQADWDRVIKTYLAVVEGAPAPAAGVVDNFLAEGDNLRVRAVRSDAPNARRAVSRYRLVRRAGGHSLVEVELGTGRKHQIRVHLAGLGCPVVGDEAYGATTGPAGRLGLHAWKMAFDHPLTGDRLRFTSPLPASLRKVAGGPPDEPPHGPRTPADFARRDRRNRLP